jgi:uncharacterized protein (DUF427 family)
MRAAAFDPNPAPGFRRNPGKVIRIEPFRGEVSVSVAGTPIARSRRALLLSEDGHAPAYYLPAEDVVAGCLKRSAHVSHCSFKGEASYWNARAAGREIDNAAWSYDMPYDEMLEIAGLVSFYPAKVEVRVRPE